MYKVNPCVDDFTLDQNRSCSICNKVVVDLTDKTEEEVVQLYNINKGNLCGSAPSRYFNSSYYLHPFKRFAFSVILVFGSALFVLDAAAQDSIQAIQQEASLVSKINNDTLIIKGKVIDDDGEGVPFVRVYIEQGEFVYGSTTNIYGEYQIKLENLKWSSDTLKVICRSIEYKKEEKHIVKDENNIHSLDFNLSQSFMLTGEIVVGRVRIIDHSPDAHRSTTIKADEIKRLQRK